MNIVTVKSNLRELLSIVERSSTTHQNLPVLKNVLLEAKGGILHASATNLELATKAHIPVKVIEEGVLCIPLAPLMNIVSNVPSERITLESEGVHARLSTDNYTATLLGNSPEDFPLIPAVSPIAGPIRLQGEVLKSALQNVCIAAQHAGIRPELSSVSVQFRVDDMVFAATDIFRLAEKTVPQSQFQAPSQESFTVLLPIPTVYEFLRIIQDNEEISFVCDKNQIACSSPRFELTSRLIDGSFPQYQTIVPKEFAGRVKVSRHDMVGAVKLIGVLSNKNNEVILEAAKNGKSISLSGADDVSGNNTAVIPATLEGSVGKVVLNWKYLFDGLKAVEDEEIFLGLHPEKPCMIKSSSDPSYFYILAPVVNP